MGHVLETMGIFEVVEVLRDFSSQERVFFQKNHKQICGKFFKIMNSSDHASEALKAAINSKYEDDQEDLKDVENKIKLRQEMMKVKNPRLSTEQFLRH